MMLLLTLSTLLPFSLWSNNCITFIPIPKKSLAMAMFSEIGGNPVNTKERSIPLVVFKNYSSSMAIYHTFNTSKLAFYEAMVSSGQWSSDIKVERLKNRVQELSGLYATLLKSRREQVQIIAEKEYAIASRQQLEQRKAHLYDRMKNYMPHNREIATYDRALLTLARTRDNDHREMASHLESISTRKKAQLYDQWRGKSFSQGRDFNVEEEMSEIRDHQDQYDAIEEELSSLAKEYSRVHFDLERETIGVVDRMMGSSLSIDKTNPRVKEAFDDMEFLAKTLKMIGITVLPEIP